MCLGHRFSGWRISVPFGESGTGLISESDGDDDVGEKWGKFHYERGKSLSHPVLVAVTGVAKFPLAQAHELFPT